MPTTLGSSCFSLVKLLIQWNIKAFFCCNINLKCVTSKTKEREKAVGKRQVRAGEREEKGGEDEGTIIFSELDLRTTLTFLNFNYFFLNKVKLGKVK